MKSTACRSPASGRGDRRVRSPWRRRFRCTSSKIDADVLILHEPNPWALLSYAAARPRLPLAIWFHSDVVRPALQYQLFYAPIARPAYRAARRFLVSSPALGEHAVALEPFRDRVTVIPFGIDVDAWRPSDSVQAAGGRDSACGERPDRALCRPARALQRCARAHRSRRAPRGGRGDCGQWSDAGRVERARQAPVRSGALQLSGRGG